MEGFSGTDNQGQGRVTAKSCPIFRAEEEQTPGFDVPPPWVVCLITRAFGSIYLAHRLHPLIDKVLRPAIRIEEARFARVQADVAVQCGEDFLAFDRTSSRARAASVAGA